MKYLFIGGVADGNWIEVPKYHTTYWIPIPTKLDLEYQAFDPSKLKPDQQLYYKAKISSDLYIFTLPTFSSYDVLGRLIEGYKKY